ncbi:MAG: hypothetical protein H6727_02660 [Myxococcales bacterium]|nr:hypothetical protein [Myxococcales bacterium]
MAGQVESVEPTGQKLLSLLLVASDGRIVHAEQDLSRRWGLPLPPWKGVHVQTFMSWCLASATPFDTNTLTEATRGARELSCSLKNGRRLLVGVRSLWLSPRGVSELVGNDIWVDPAGSGQEKKFFLLSCLCIDHVAHMYRSAAEVKLRSTIGSIIAGFAHEVRNPLAAIVSLTEGVMNPDMGEETLRALSRIPVLVERIENLLKVALSYGRPRPPRASWHQLGGVLTKSLEILELAGVGTFSELLPKEHMNVPIYVDREHVISVITNLLQNAIEEAGVENVRIRVEPSPRLSGESYLYSHGAVVAVDFIDKGRGVSPENREHIFEPFFTTKSNGTGLGLALARDLARLNDGDLILLETGVGGSAFRLLLPTHAS